MPATKVAGIFFEAQECVGDPGPNLLDLCRRSAVELAHSSRPNRFCPDRRVAARLAVGVDV
jgi:hypothetical protein